MKNIIFYLSSALLLTVDAYAQSRSHQKPNVKPAYQVFDSYCIDENDDIEYIRKVLDEAEAQRFEEQEAESLAMNRLKNLSYEILPTDENANWLAARLMLEQDENLWKGVFEIDYRDGDKIKTARVEKNRVLELLWKFRDILKGASAYDTEALYLAECATGQCYNGKFFPSTNPAMLPPDSASGNLILRVSDKDQDIGVEWDLSKSVIESYRRFQTAEEKSPHQTSKEQCLVLSCRQETKDIQMTDEKFQKLLEDYNFFVRHLELLIKQSIPPKDSTE